MNDESHSLIPSGSTTASTIGAFLAATIMMVLGHYKVYAPAGYEALLGGVIAVLCGYIPKSGRLPKL